MEPRRASSAKSALFSDGRPMKPQHFSFGPSAAHRISIRRRFNRVDIACGYEVLARNARAGTFRTGRIFPLSDGARVKVRRSALPAYGGWAVWMDDRLLPGSVGTRAHGRRSARRAGWLLCVLAIAFLLAGAGVQGLGADSWTLPHLQRGWAPALPGLLLALAALIVHRTASLIALALAIAFLLADGAMAWASHSGAVRPLLIANTGMRLLCVAALMLAWTAIVRARGDADFG